MSHIPPEIVLVFLEHAYYTPWGDPDYALLASCSLVCTSWSLPAQSLLFRKTIQLRWKTALFFHAALISSAARVKSLGHFVRSLNIVVGRDYRWCPPVGFAQILQACPNIHTVALGTHALHEFNRFEFAKLKDSGQSIRSLDLGHCDVRSPVLFQLLDIWPRIRFLTIANVKLEPWPRYAGMLVFRRPRSGARHPTPTVDLGSTHVMLYDLTLECIPRPEVLSWLLGSSTTSLTILDLQGGPGVAAREILAVHAPHLRSLRLAYLTTDSAEFLRQCTRLEELVVYGVLGNVPLAPNLSPSIEYLTFQSPIFDTEIPLPPILDAIEVLPRLRMITCSPSAEGLREFEILTARCAEKGVEVVVPEVRFWEHGDTVVVHHSPRRPWSRFRADDKLKWVVWQ